MLVTAMTRPTPTLSSFVTVVACESGFIPLSSTVVRKLLAHNKNSKTQLYTFPTILSLILDCFKSFLTCLNTPSSHIVSILKEIHSKHPKIHTYIHMAFIHLEIQHHSTTQPNYHPILCLNMHISPSISSIKLYQPTLPLWTF